MPICGPSTAVVALHRRERRGFGEHRPLLLGDLDVEEARDAPHLARQVRLQSL